jgi:hypothetical protein
MAERRVRPTAPLNSGDRVIFPCGSIRIVHGGLFLHGTAGDPGRNMAPIEKAFGEGWELTVAKIYGVPEHELHGDWPVAPDEERLLALVQAIFDAYKPKGISSKEDMEALYG